MREGINKLVYVVECERTDESVRHSACLCTLSSVRTSSAPCLTRETLTTKKIKVKNVRKRESKRE